MVQFSHMTVVIGDEALINEGVTITTNDTFFSTSTCARVCVRVCVLCVCVCLYMCVRVCDVLVCVRMCIMCVMQQIY